MPGSVGGSIIITNLSVGAGVLLVSTLKILRSVLAVSGSLVSPPVAAVLQSLKCKIFQINISQIFSN